MPSVNGRWNNEEKSEHMHEGKSQKVISELSATQRLEQARAKLSKPKGVVDALLQHMRAHENTKWLLYNSHVVAQIPASHAAYAFRELQRSVLHYEVFRLCTFWDKVDFDSRSIPTVVALVDCKDVIQRVYGNHAAQYSDDHEAFGKEDGDKGRRRLQKAIRDAREIEGSGLLARVRNYRDNIAHQLESTRVEKKGPVSVPLSGDERTLFQKTVDIVDLLYVSLCGTDFAWDDSKKIHERNAEAFWKGVSINVPR